MFQTIMLKIIKKNHQTDYHYLQKKLIEKKFSSLLKLNLKNLVCRYSICINVL